MLDSFSALSKKKNVAKPKKGYFELTFVCKIQQKVDFHAWVKIVESLIKFFTSSQNVNLR